MADNGVLNFKDVQLKLIAQAHFEFNTIMGLAYHGVAFSAATACALFRKYDVYVNYCHDRKIPDSRGRML